MTFLSGPGRGSGAGSVVAWSLLITGIDPLQFGLLFERFLNPERVSMPDFDIDFCQERREEVIAYVQERYGTRPRRPDHHLRHPAGARRAARRRSGAAAAARPGRSPGQDDPQQSGQSGHSGAGIEMEPRLQDMPARGRGGRRDAGHWPCKLEGLYRNASTHAAGVVIADRPLTELTPLYRDPRSPACPATQFNMKWVESAGLVKFDFLGLKTLTVIHRAVKLLERRGAGLNSSTCRSTTQLPMNCFPRAIPSGCSRWKARACATPCANSGHRSVEEITALISLYRPGPMDSIDEYVDCKMGRRPVNILPGLEAALAETYGVIVYQEQVMRIAQVLAGYSLGEADLLRRAMGKKKKEEMDQQRARFLSGAKERGLPLIESETMFERMAKFAGYGFNKCHAAPYALIAYQTAWLKANATGRVLRRLDEPGHLQHRQARGFLPGRQTPGRHHPAAGCQSIWRRLRG